MLFLHPGSGHQGHPGLLSRHGAILFARNAAASTLCFALDMGLIWLLVSRAGVDKFAAVTTGFFAANSLNYILARLWVFPESERGLFAGYLYYFANACIGLTVILAGFAVMTSLGAHYLVARCVVSVLAGTLVFVLNATWNFHEV